MNHIYKDLQSINERGGVPFETLRQFFKLCIDNEEL